MNKHFKILALALGISFGLAACGNTSNGTDSEASQSSQSLEGQALIDKVQPIVDKSSGGQFQVSKTFDGPDNLKGLVIGPAGGMSGAKMIAWATPNGEYLIPGPIFDKDGNNLSEAALEEHADFLPTSQLADTVMERGFIVGESGPIVTIFFEPYCGYCAQLWQGLKPLVDNGELRIRPILVGFMAPDSLERAASIQYSDNPAQALSEWEDTSDKRGAEAATAPQEHMAYIEENNSIMNNAGITGTPAVLYCDNGSNSLELIKGMPGDIPGFAKAIGDSGHEICG